MKTKIKRHSRSFISVLLAVCMLVSCMTVGIIATDAARVTDSSEAVAAKVDSNSTAAISTKPDNVYGNFNNTGWRDYGTTDSGNTSITDYIYITQNDNLLLRNGSQYWRPGEGATDVTTSGVHFYFNSGYSGNGYISASSGTKKIHIDWGENNGYENPWVWVSNETAPDYYVRLNNGNGWAPTKMSFNAGVYSVTYTNVPAGSQKYKLTSDTNWTLAPNAGTTSKISLTIDGVSSSVGGGGNNDVTFSTTSVSDITFTYDLNTDETTITTTSSAPAVTYKLHINNNSTGVDMTAVSDNSIYYYQGNCNNNDSFYITDGTNTLRAASTFNVSAMDTKVPLSSSGSQNVQFNITNTNNVYVCYKPATKEFWFSTTQPVASWPPAFVSSLTNNPTDRTVVYNNGDDGSVLANNAAGRKVVVPKSNTGKTDYWADLSDLIPNFTANNTNHMRVALSDTSDGDTSGINSSYTGTADYQTNSVLGNASVSNYNFSGSTQNARVAYAATKSDYSIGNITHLGVRIQVSGSTITYTFYTDNNETVTPDDPEVTVSTVDIYAKDGTLRDGYQKFSEFIVTNITDIKDAEGNDLTALESAVTRYNYQNTSKKSTTQNLTNGTSSSDRLDYAKVSGVPVGSTITVTARVYEKSQWGDDWYGSNFNATHYVKGFCINGYTPELYTWKAADTGNAYTDYTMTYTILEEDVALDRSSKGYIEITPIVYLKDETYTKTFYIEGYDRTSADYKRLGWGTTLGIYPYYDGIKESGNAFGGYPGQPMLFYKGRYEIQVPLTRDGTASGAKCLGITLSNNYWDMLHRSLDVSIGNNDTGHRQTYDFDDFYKINEEKNPDQIIFSFKLREQTDNFGDGYTRDTFDYADASEKTLYRDANNVLYKSDGTTEFSKNGVDEYKDALGRDVNLFGKVLTDNTQRTNPKLLVVSNGYKYTYVGKYATEWVVYKQEATSDKAGMTKYTYVTQIAPSALVLNTKDSFATYTGGTSTAAATGPKPLGNYQTAYTTLNAAPYNDRGFEICYERNQYIASDDKADRLDGRWLYSKNGDLINASVKIQYKDSANAEWTDEANYSTGYDSKANKSVHTNALAYFTNVTPKDIDGLMEATEIPIVPGSYFTFKTVAPTDQEHMNYVFKGWYVSLNGSDPVAIDSVPQLESHLEMTGSAVIIARYEKLTSGILTIGHTVSTGTVSGTTYNNVTGTFNGSGTAYLKVELLNRNNEVKDTFAETSTGQYSTTKYMTTAYAANGYKFRISLRTVDANEDNKYKTTTETGSLGSLSGTSPTTASGTMDSTSNPANCRVITIPISSFFSGDTQTVTSLQYTSYFNLTEYTYKYVINYKFPTRLYGDEVYKVESGNIAGNKATAYFEDTKENAKLKREIIEGNTPFETNFRKAMTWRYGDAYNGTITDATDYTKQGQMNTHDGTVYTITVNVLAEETNNTSVHAMFMLPYDYDATTKAAKAYQVYNGQDTYDTAKDRGKQENPADRYELFNAETGEPQYGDSTSYGDSDGKYLMYDETAPADSPRKTYDNLTPSTQAAETTQSGESEIVGYNNSAASFTLEAAYGGLITYDGVISGKQSHFVTAPRYIYVANGASVEKDNFNHKIYDNVTYHTHRETTTFRTYDVTTDAQYVSYNNVRDGIVADNGYTKKYFTRWDIFSQSSNSYLTSCYYYDFNYTSYEDIYVIPVFESAKESAFIDEASNRGLFASVSFLENSRNQWNTNINDTNTNYSNADKVYSDFAIAYGFDGNIIEEIQQSNKEVRVGMLIERLDKLKGVDAPGETVVTDPSAYMHTFGETEATAYANMIKTDAGESASYKAENYNTVLVGNAVNCKIASNNSGWSSRALTTLDNKNRLEYYYGFNKLLNSANYETYKYAYRAVAYIMVKNGETWDIAISSPTYFTIYDMATRTK